MQTSLRGSPLKSDGVDGTGDANQTLVLVAHRTTGLGGQTTLGVDPDSFIQKTEQSAGRKRRTGGRLAMKRIPDETVLRRDIQWDIPWKRALFISDGPDSTTSGSDIPEGQSDRPPEVEYSDIRISGRPQDDSGTEELCSPSRQLEIALGISGWNSPGRSRFTSTPVPRLSGKSNWEQYRQVFEAIVCSNGSDDVTEALQLLSHLDGDALNVAFTGPGISASGAVIFL